MPSPYLPATTRTPAPHQGLLKGKYCRIMADFQKQRSIEINRARSPAGSVDGTVPVELSSPRSYMSEATTTYSSSYYGSPGSVASASNGSVSSRSHASGAPHLPAKLGRANGADVDREIAAEQKALRLFNQTVNREENGFRKDVGLTKSQKAEMKRQEAIRRYKLAKATGQKNVPTALAKPKEAMAETSRKVNVVGNQDEFETIADFKCQMDRDREVEAKKKALRLINLVPGINVC